MEKQCVFSDCYFCLSKSCLNLFDFVGHQAPLSMGFLKQEYWSGLPFPPPGDYPNPGMEPKSPVSLALAGRFFTTAPSGKPQRGRSGHYIPGAQLTKSTKL